MQSNFITALELPIHSDIYGTASHTADDPDFRQPACSSIDVPSSLSACQASSLLLYSTFPHVLQSQLLTKDEHLILPVSLGAPVMLREDCCRRRALRSNFTSMRLKYDILTYALPPVSFANCPSNPAQRNQNCLSA
ncbi:hypothetical protein J1614_005648 [Plenodomus biglobosus]|nr:hypothetical protein J1614_005648 [Plenodomus biglobosus]